MTDNIKLSLENWEGRIEAIKLIDDSFPSRNLKKMYLDDLIEGKEALKSLLFFKEAMGISENK